MSKRIQWTEQDIDAVTLASAGYSNDYITSETNRSMGQITYRMKVLGMKTTRRDYRNGRSPFAQLVREMLHQMPDNEAAVRASSLQKAQPKVINQRTIIYRKHKRPVRVH